MGEIGVAADQGQANARTLDLPAESSEVIVIEAFQENCADVDPIGTHAGGHAGESGKRHLARSNARKKGDW
jgi:hypothetical protein